MLKLVLKRLDFKGSESCHWEMLIINNYWSFSISNGVEKVYPINNTGTIILSLVLSALHVSI